MQIIDGIKWDFGPEDEILYFDRSKSYYLTKYRPIDEENGLDFKVEWFDEPARTKERTGKYSQYPRGTKAYADYWNERMTRCKNGYYINGYRLTGDNYFFLNFYRMISAASEDGDESFPTFTNVQYEWFHYVEMCEKLKKDCIALKPRGVGWSEMAASMNVCPYITTPNKRMFCTASYELAVAKLLAKCWVQLDWLNINTEQAFLRVRQAKNSEWHKRASKLSKDRTESGHMSEIEGVIADIPRKVRGDRCHRLFFEEAGSNAVLKTSWVQGKALVTRGGRKMGTRFAWGTGGDHGPQLAGLSDMFYSPDQFGVLPFKHNYSATGEEVLTGFFFPAYRMHFDYLDDRGVTNSAKAKEEFERDRNSLRTDPKAYMENCSEYCFTPEEALIRQGENQFNQELLAEQMAQLLIHKTVQLPKRGYLKYKDPDNQEKGLQWRDDMHGDIILVEPPELDDNNVPLANLYVAGIDAIDQGTKDSTGQKDVSDFCIVIKKRQHGLNPPKYVAMYKCRPADIRFAYGNAMRIMEWYGCKGVLEATRTNFKSYLQEQKKLHLLMKRPRATMTTSGGQNTQMYGAPANEQTIIHYLELIENFVNDYSHTISMESMLDQLLKYDYEKKRKFDIIAAMGMAELGDQELYSKPIRSREQYKKEWRDIGYFRDRTGKMHYGPVPSKDELETYHLR